MIHDKYRYGGKHPTYTGPQEVWRNDTHRILWIADYFNKPFVTHYYIEERGKEWTRLPRSGFGFETPEEALEAAGISLPKED